MQFMHHNSSAVAEMGDRGHNRHMGRKEGGRGGAGSPSNTMWPGPRSTSVPNGVLIPSSPFGHNGHGPKIGGCAPFVEADWVPPNTVCPEPRPTSMPSFI